MTKYFIQKFKHLTSCACRLKLTTISVSKAVLLDHMTEHILVQVFDMKT